MLENIVSVIEMDMANDDFIKKHEIEDFYTGSQLLVHQSQEAVFFMDREALDSFGPGRHTLTTENMPIVSRFFNIASGGKTPFRSELYFINKTTKLDVKWGTSSKMEYTNPGEYKFPVKIGASGTMHLAVSDGRKLLLQLVGTGQGIGASEFTVLMRELVNSQLKSFMTEYIISHNINIFDIENHLEPMNLAMQEKLSGAFDEYGVQLKNFIISTIAKPEDDPEYKEFRRLYTQMTNKRLAATGRQIEGLIDQETRSKQIVMEAQALAAKRALEGYTYQDERRFDVAEQFAQNEATGQLANMGIGLGMISGIGGAVGGSVGGIVGGALNQTVAAAATASQPAAGGGNAATTACAKCGAAIAANAKFCPECGEKCVPSGSMICPGCGKIIPKSKFCPECGFRLAEPTCPKCSAKLAAGSKFCPECGEKLI